MMNFTLKYSKNNDYLGYFIVFKTMLSGISMLSILYSILMIILCFLYGRKFVTLVLCCDQGILKGELGLFLTPVLMLCGGGLLTITMEVSHCTFGFGAIIRHDLRTLSLLRDSPCDNYMRVGFKSMQERQLTLNEIAWWLNCKKIQRYNNSPPYMTSRWLPQQIPPLNFLGSDLFIMVQDSKA